MDTYFVGYDSREHEAAMVCAHSILIRSTRRAQVIFVEHRALRREKLFTRVWQIDAEGQYKDMLDGRPFSTEFSHSRFLVFFLANELKLKGPCMFVDCDWLFLADPSSIMEKQERAGNKIGVVMRDREVVEGSKKMDGMVQQNYTRKLWSAMFTFNPQPELALMFAPSVVNSNSGRDLHNFLGMEDSEFWPINPRWHYIPSLDGEVKKPKGIHFSEFSPWLNPDKYGTAPEAFDAWEKAYSAWLYYSVNTGTTCMDLKLENALEAARS